MRPVNGMPLAASNMSPDWSLLDNAAGCWGKSLLTLTGPAVPPPETLKPRPRLLFCNVTRNVFSGKKIRNIFIVLTRTTSHYAQVCFVYSTCFTRAISIFSFLELSRYEIISLIEKFAVNCITLFEYWISWSDFLFTRSYSVYSDRYLKNFIL